jgi:hypothetical protein
MIAVVDDSVAIVVETVQAIVEVRNDLSETWPPT